MKRYGLIGYPLSHSFSQGYFQEKFRREGIRDAVYENYALPGIEGLKDLLDRLPDLEGLNVTIPYKEQVLRFLDSTDPAAGEIGAVNTIKINHSGDTYSLTGFNTDVWGFEISLKEGLHEWHRRALILGTGGASKAVAWVLKKVGIPYTLISRNRKAGALCYGDVDKDLLQRSLLIVNCTPAGMFPKTDEAPPLPYQWLTPRHYLYDLIYNPGETLFLQKGREAGAYCRNGLAMLHLQAEKSWEIWTQG